MAATTTTATTSPRYKLYYFDSIGGGELIRLIFHAAKQDFEDFRFSREEWATIKPTVPGGLVPYLETPDRPVGQGMTQTLAIARYLCRKYGFYHKRDEKVYLVERAVEQVRDILMEFIKVFFSPDADKKPIMLQEYQSTKLPLQMQELKRFLDEKGGPFFGGSKKVSLADFYLMCLSDILFAHGNVDLKEQYPFLKDHYEAVLKKQPEVAVYIANRKK